MEILSLRIFSVVLFLSILSYSCTDSSTNGDSGPAVMEGQVESVSANQTQSSQTQDVEGAIVTANEVTTGGNLDIIGDTEAETDSEGEYTLEVEGEALTEVPSTSRIVVLAESEEGIGKAFITTDVISGTLVQVKPVTIESTVEANILQEVVANGDEGTVSNADIEVAVEGEMALALDGNTEAVSDLALLLADQSTIRSEFYNRQGIEFNEEDIEQLQRDAQIELENSLFDIRGSEGEQESVFQNFLDTYASAEIEAGVEASAVAKSTELAALVAINDDTAIPREVQTELYRNKSYKTAVALDLAVRNELESIGADESTIDIAEDAGGVLQTEIRDATAASEEEINSMFADYRSKVVTAIESDGILNGNTFVTVNNIVSGEGGAKADFDSAVEGTSDPQFIVDAYSEFLSSVRSTVNSSFPEADELQAETYTELLVLLNIAS